MSRNYGHNHPPFPDNEEQEAESDARVLDSDDEEEDEGEDIFTSARLPRAVNTQTFSGPGLLKMINRASDAVNKTSVKMNESDNWFESKLQEVENEEQLLRRLHAAVDSLVNHRKELCSNTAVFSKSVAMLGSVEENSALSHALSQLAEVEDKMEQLHQQQTFSDFFILAELLADYVRLLAAVRCCFEQRMKVWQRLQETQSTLQKKREAEDKLLWWESKVSQYEIDFERVTCTVRKEVLRFEKEKARDFKQHIVKYLESLLHTQTRLVKCSCLRPKPSPDQSLTSHAPNL